MIILFWLLIKMKAFKFISQLVLLLICTTACSEYDDGELWDKVNSLDDRVTVSIQQTPYFPLWKFFLVLREFKTWNNEELNFRRI